MEKMALQILQILYIFVLHEEKVTIFAINFSSKMVTFSLHNTNIYKICILCEAVFSMFYNISPPNLAILLILGCSF